MRGRPASVALVGLVALCAMPALAADQLLLGKRLSIKNPSGGSNRVVHLARDASVTVGNAGGTADPQCSGAGGGGTSSIHIQASGGAGDISIPLPCGGWTTNAANTLYRYRDTSGATCRLVLVKHHVLVKAVCSGAQVAIDLNGSTAPVALATTLNAERYCTTFGGTVVHDGSNDQVFLAKDAPAPVACPETTTTTTSTSTSSTTPTWCCALPGRCTFQNPNQNEFFCESAGGTLHADEECDGSTGGCTAGSPVAGPCCQRNFVVPSSVSCETGPSVSGATCTTGGNWIASFYPSAVCTTGGTCQP